MTTLDLSQLVTAEMKAAQRKVAERATIDRERDEAINGGFYFNDVKFQSRPEDRENISGASTAALAAIVNGAQPGNYRWHGGDEDFAWIAEDNSLIVMDAHTMFAFGQAAMRHKQDLIFEARNAKDNI